MSLWLLLLVQVASSATAVAGFDLPPSATAPTLSGASPCVSPAAGDDVVVCAGRADRYRLPLSREREVSAAPTRGDTGSGMAALTQPGRCGIFAGERQCGKREKADYGYGNGRDPVTLVTRLGKKVLDPDAE